MHAIELLVVVRGQPWLWEFVFYPVWDTISFLCVCCIHWASCPSTIEDSPVSVPSPIPHPHAPFSLYECCDSDTLTTASSFYMSPRDLNSGLCTFSGMPSELSLHFDYFSSVLFCFQQRPSVFLPFQPIAGTMLPSFGPSLFCMLP